MSFMYTLAGIYHFVKPKLYLMIMPPFIPFKKQVNWITGLAELVLGLLLLIPSFKSIAALGIIILLIAVYPANIYHIIQNRKKTILPEWTLWVRLPLQFLLIYWAYQYI